MTNINLIGIAISKGIVIGKVKKIDFTSGNEYTQNSTKAEADSEINKFKNIINELVHESKRISEKYRHKDKIRSIIEAEIMFLEDPELQTVVNNNIFYERK